MILFAELHIFVGCDIQFFKMDSHDFSCEKAVFNVTPKIPRASRSGVHEQRCKSLAEADSTPGGFSHLQAVLVPGTDKFTNAYDIFGANFITTIIRLVYFYDHKIPTFADTAIKLLTTAGGCWSSH